MAIDDEGFCSLNCIFAVWKISLYIIAHILYITAILLLAI